MVQHFLKSMYKEIRGLHQAAYVLALFTFGSQLLALIRDRLLAHTFGAGATLDVYYTAFRIPDFLYVFFVSTLSVYVLIPFIAERIDTQSATRARALLSQIFSLFLICYSVIAALVFIFAPEIVAVMFPGFADSHTTLTLLMRILLLQPLFLGVSSLYGVVAQLEHRFVIHAVSPLLYNLGIIFGILCLYPYFGVMGLAYGVVLGAVFHLIVQFPIARQSELWPTFTRMFEWGEIRAVLRASSLRALTLSLHQFVLLGFVGFASLMAVGSVSVFQFAYNLQSVPLAIIGVSYSVAAFPYLAQLFAEKKFEAFGAHIVTACKHIVFWSIPAMMLFIVIRAQFVRVVLGTGAFDWDDTRLTAAVLALFMLSLTSQAIHLLLVRALYAANNTILPLCISLYSSACAVLLGFIFHILLMHEGVFRYGVTVLMRLEGVTGIEVLALPLGYSLALILQSILLVYFGRYILSLRPRLLVRPLAQALFAGAFAGITAYGALNIFVLYTEATTFFTTLFQGFFAGGVGLVMYFLVQHMLKNEEWREVVRSFNERSIRRGDVMVPQEEDTLSV